MLHQPLDYPFAPQANQMFSFTLSSLFEGLQPDIAHTCCNQGIHWPASPDRIAGSGINQSRSSIFLKSSADKLLVFIWLQAEVQFLLMHRK